MDEIKVFISYAHEDDNYKEWVKSLVDRLIKHGINVKFDQYDLHLTDSITQFMENSISDSNFVILLISKNYIAKAKERTGGVGYEVDLTTGEIYANKFRSKFIPILVEVDYPEVPEFLKGFNALKIDDLSSYDDIYLKLYSYITGQPLQKRPEIGKIIPINDLKDQINENKLNINTICNKYGLSNYAHTKLQINLCNFNGEKINQLFPIYQKYFLKLQSAQNDIPKYYPLTLDPRNKKRNAPFVEYVSEDYIGSISNWKLIDRILFLDNVITYESLEMSDQEKVIYSSRVPFISVLFIFEFLRKMYTRLDIKEIIDIDFKISGNKEIYFDTNSLFSIFGNWLEMYKLNESSDSFKIPKFTLDNASIRTFFDKCISLFVSENQCSDIPYMSIVDESYYEIINDINTGKYHY